MSTSSSYRGVVRAARIFILLSNGLISGGDRSALGSRVPPVRRCLCCNSWGIVQRPNSIFPTSEVGLGLDEISGNIGSHYLTVCAGSTARCRVYHGK